MTSSFRTTSTTRLRREAPLSTRSVFRKLCKKGLDHDGDQNKWIVMMRLMVPLMIVVMILIYEDREGLGHRIEHQGKLSLKGGDEFIIYGYNIFIGI